VRSLVRESGRLVLQVVEASLAPPQHLATHRITNASQDTLHDYGKLLEDMELTDATLRWTGGASWRPASYESLTSKTWGSRFRSKPPERGHYTRGYFSGVRIGQGLAAAGACLAGTKEIDSKISGVYSLALFPWLNRFPFTLSHMYDMIYYVYYYSLSCRTWDSILTSRPTSSAVAAIKCVSY